jgi:hypothetical protein
MKRSLLILPVLLLVAAAPFKIQSAPGRAQGAEERPWVIPSE